MSVTFVKGENSVTLPDPAPGYSIRTHRRQAIGRTAGGALYVYDKGVETFEAEPLFESLSAGEKNALAAFFKDVTLGGRETFSYTDSNGISCTARFADARLDFVKVAAEVWDIRIRLELSQMGA